MTIKIGLIGYGKAGKAVASIFDLDNRYTLEWVYRRVQKKNSDNVFSKEEISIVKLIEEHPVDLIIDFSSAKSILAYGDIAADLRITILSAVSSYNEAQIAYLHKLSEKTVVFWSPNITFGINFLLYAAKQLKRISPGIDIGIIEEHFKSKPEVSGTAKKIAAALDIKEDEINSIRVGGIVGKHEIIFGLPFQTIRLTHEAISREAFGTGAAFIAEHLIGLPNGFYCFEDILAKVMD